MKLSEHLRNGSNAFPSQARHQICDTDRIGQVSLCALGCIYWSFYGEIPVPHIGMKIASNKEIFSVIDPHMFENKHQHPLFHEDSPPKYNIYGIITSMNDDFLASCDEIATWLEGIGQ